MAKGSRVDQFQVGDRVAFITDMGHKVFEKQPDAKGRLVDVFVRNVPLAIENFGRIGKLHKSGRQGVAEIYPENELAETGFKKISRKLQHVTKASEV